MLYHVDRYINCSKRTIIIDYVKAIFASTTGTFR